MRDENNERKKLGDFVVDQRPTHLEEQRTHGGWLASVDALFVAGILAALGLIFGVSGLGSVGIGMLAGLGFFFVAYAAQRAQRETERKAEERGRRRD